MTNEEIIMMNQMALVESGKIAEEDDIHTYQMWKSLGYQVRKGEHAVAKFQIWKPSKGKKVEAEDGSVEVKKPYMFLKMSSFFSTAQVEPIA